MRRHILAAGVAAAVLIPSIAAAQQTCEQQRSARVGGTVVGAGVGALLGSAIAGRGDRTAGAIIGGVGGAIAGNQLAKPDADCAHAYGYYDSNGAWHANAVARTDARGYYDRAGTWVDGAPNGYYDAQGRWTPVDANAAAAGYYDRDNRWIPASANGYYGPDGQWVGGTASGYYQGGRWIAGPATGRYDQNGRWMPGQANGRRDANGVWVADAQPGYYDANGRWRAGPAYGYYDAQGRWIATQAAAPTRVNYTRPSIWDDAPADVRERQTWLERIIRRGVAEGSVTRNDGDRALRTLAALSRETRGMRAPKGRLSRRDETYIQARLDTIGASIRWTRPNEPRRN